MKPSLERTAILCKDVLEQDLEGESRYIVMLLDSNVTLAADAIIQHERDVSVLFDGKTVAQFSPAVPWLMIARDKVDIITREQQIRRHLDNKAAEAVLERTIAAEAPIGQNGHASHESAPGREPGTGQYL